MKTIRILNKARSSPNLSNSNRGSFQEPSNTSAGQGNLYYLEVSDLLPCLLGSGTGPYN
jgi:hypothetical protein